MAVPIHTDTISMGLSLPQIQKGLLSVTSEILVNCLVKLGAGLGELIVPTYP